LSNFGFIGQSALEAPPEEIFDDMPLTPADMNLKSLESVVALSLEGY
jgi:hypothetical protein